ncbi:hypothetical protein AWH48_17110 [Domibacillus aminovorans]|uniref:Bacterial Ig-like domain-containing protein n=1 Tax=Domibacillus aminovorans TaxID=29332 RepID=A0A177KZ60_9BACI|nr:immunoglobulin-like domain-containing protein [Domibacillus aminovorans]OAH58708.1 hypothetical protein AWH48_17110 [Domibacillus aminovorans]
MKKYSLVAFCFAALFLLITGCQPDGPQDTKNSDTHLIEEAPAQESPNSENGVTIKTEKAQYTTSVERIIIEIRNDSNTQYDTGTQVFLEKKIEDIWYKVPMKADSFTEEGIVHFPGELSSMGFDVNDLKYELTPGEYRAILDGLAAPFEVIE